MPPKKIIETNASSIIDLKALVSQQKEKFNRERHEPRIRTESKKKSWATNRGVNERAKRDTVMEDGLEESDAVEKSRRILERKAKLYDTLQYQHRRNDSDDYDDNPDILIDFDQKYISHRSRSPPLLKKSDPIDDPWVEYEDEFGRTRVVRKSALPQQSPSPSSSSSSRGSTPERRDPMLEYADRANIRHYDAGQEIRTKGVGHYSFDTEDATRHDQMASLNALRKETESARKQSRTASERRKAILAKRAEFVHQRWAKLRPSHPSIVNEDSITQLLQTMRQKVEK